MHSEAAETVVPAERFNTGKDLEELLSNSAAAQELGGKYAGGVSEATIRRYLTLGKLRRFKFGARTFVKRGDLLKLILVS
jgi:hypothetical protein